MLPSATSPFSSAAFYKGFFIYLRLKEGKNCCEFSKHHGLDYNYQWKVENDYKKVSHKKFDAIMLKMKHNRESSMRLIAEYIIHELNHPANSKIRIQSPSPRLQSKNINIY